MALTIEISYMDEPTNPLDPVPAAKKRIKNAAGVLLPPLLKRLMDSDPKLGFAFRTVVEKVKNGELTAEDIIVKLSKRKSRA